MGYFRGLTHGAIIGAAIGILYAPSAGTDFRRQLSRWLGESAAAPATETGGEPMSATSARRRTSGGTETRNRRP
jgi:gas vesicle protein